MSGYKYSQVRLEKQREERLKLLGQIGESKGRLDGLTAKMREILDRTPEGVKATFERELREAVNWLREVDSHSPGVLGMETDSGTLKSEVSDLKSLLESGARIHRTTVESFTEKADAMGKTLAVKLSQLQAMSLGYRELLRIWFSQEKLGGLDAELSRYESLLHEMQLRDLGGYLEQTETLLSSLASEANEMEEKHYKRLYVLKALREVCGQLGFRETEPYYEKGIDVERRSRVVYEVDTVDQGMIKFYLSLEGIETDSRVAEKRCLGEFDKLSKELQEQFGIITAFKLGDDKPTERLIRKGEKDLEDDGSYEEASR